MDPNEPVMSDDDDSDWTTESESEGETTGFKDSEARLLDEIEDARKALASCPPDHPDRAGRATELAYYVYTGYSQSGDISLIDEAIQLGREVLALQPPGHSNWATSCANLGAFLHGRYELSGDIALLDEAINLGRQALELQPPGHPDREHSCGNLGGLLHACYEQSGNVALLNEAIQLEREVLALQPPGHPDRASSCGNLATSLQVHYEQTGNVTLLDEAIKLGREALASQSPVHSNRANSCVGLAASLYLCYKRTGDVALLDQLIGLQREALELRPPGHPDRANSCVSLGTSLQVRYEQTGHVMLLDEATELLREALALRPPGHPDQASGCVNLAASLFVRYKHSGDVALLDEVLELEREALELRPPGHPDRAHSCASRGSSLHMQYKETGDIALLEEAIELQREAVALQTLGHRNRASSCINLAASLHAHYDQTGHVVLLDEAIELLREALALRPPGHPDRASSCGNLATSLHERYDQSGNVALLDEAIKLKREALALRSRGHPDRASSCVGLAVSLHMCHEQSADVTLLDEAIELEREALALQPPGHPDRAYSCLTLGASLCVRYEHTTDVALLDEGIKLQREALALQPLGHLDRANSCAALAVSLNRRYQRTGDVALLDEVIELEREALALRPPGHPTRAHSCFNLGSSLHERHRRIGGIALLDEAIELQREGLALQPPGHSDRANSFFGLAVSLHARYGQTGDVALLDEAIEACIYASKHFPASRTWNSFTQLSELHLLHNSPHYSVLTALEYLQQSFQHEANDIHRFISYICYNAELMWDSSSGWTSHAMVLLVAIYAQVVDRLPLVANFVLNTSYQLRSLKSARQIGSDACVAALLAGQPATAVTLLDRAHGVVWTQALHQRDPQMEGAPKDLAIELEDLLRAIATSTPITPVRLPEHPQDLRHRQNTRIHAILREIRAMPGLERFMLGSTYETLREAARDHPIVILVAGHSHAFAVIIPSSTNANPDLLSLDVAWDDVRTLADTTGKAHLRYRAGSTERRRTEASGQELPLDESIDQERAMRPGNFASEWSPLASLWRDVVKPVLTRLDLVKEKEIDRRPRLHWCTAGEFAHVPVHAAGIYTGEDQECCSDYVVSSYTPTLATLLRARKGLQPIRTTDAKLLLIAAEHTADARLPPLGKVKVETRGICSVAEKARVQFAASSQSVSKTEEATAALPAANLVHIACHGLQHTSEPLESAFHLSDHDVLSVSALMKLDLKDAFLAFLSACETAKGDRDQPGQAIHLAATMLFVGFKSVVATMWAMRDEDGPVVAKAFYEKLFEGEAITADTIPYALDHAVRKLRESGAPVGSWATFIHVGA